MSIRWVRCRRVLVVGCWLIAVALGSARAAESNEVPASPISATIVIHDEAGLFGPETLDEVARLGFHAVDDADRLPVTIETIETLESRSVDELALERARASRRSGIYLLISEQDREVCLLVSKDAMPRVDEDARVRIRDAFLADFREAAFDDGLRHGTEAIAAVLRNKAPIEAQGEPKFRNVGTGEPLVSRGHVRLGLGGADLILRHARSQAESMGLKVNLAVVDEGGHLIAFNRMDGARPGSGYTAQAKAVAAATFRSPTGPIPPGVEEPEPILNLGLALTAMAGGGTATPLYGGVPIEVDGQIIGAVGVGGATGEQDAEIARAGINAFLQALANQSP